ncbi:MAG: S41 family peptidase [Prevotellaceae bacterium]|jgi:carboxyl-terminal processing protease|nr:S41 family peptidase [Prevotellaceae bacterium]
MRKLAAIVAVALCGISSLPAQMSKQEQDEYVKYGQLLYYISNSYVDSADMHKLVEKAIVATLQNLDPHSTYLSADEVEMSNEPLQGSFMGIGVEFNILSDTLIVVSPIAGGPSEMVGIKAGDRIVAVDGQNIAGVGIKNNDVYKHLRGQKGSVVHLDVMRNGVAGTLQFKVTRDKIPLHSLDAAYEVSPGLVYLRLSRFSMTSVQEIEAAMATFKRQPDNLILDLRSNSGGVLQTAVDLANQFFDKGHVLVYNEGRQRPKTIDVSDGKGFFKTGGLAVLIDEGSASASEIVAGAIQDWDRGVIIGRRSFGKGMVQQLMPFRDGAQLRLTVSRYHTPTGRVIQRPYNADKVENYYAEIYKRYSNGEVYDKDSIRFPDSLKYYTLKEHRLVYGGGGIMPDIFMPLDTAYHSAYFSKMVRMGILYQFALSYMDTRRAAWQQQYRTFAAFDKQFHVDDALLDALADYAEQRQLPRNDADLAVSDVEIRMLLKAYIARILWDTGRFYEVVNQSDKAFQKAVEVLLIKK